MMYTSLLDGLRQYLPIQFPLGVFIHNNMLMAFENMPFTEGVRKAAQLYGARRAMPEDYYWRRHAQGRIQVGQLREAIQAHLRTHAVPGSIAGVPTTDVLMDYLLSRKDSEGWPQVGPTPKAWSVLASLGEWELPPRP